MASYLDQVVLAPAIKRGERAVPEPLLQRLQPIANESMAIEDARRLLADLDDLIADRIVVNCQQPVAYFNNGIVWLCVHRDGRYRDIDQFVANEVQESYFLNQFARTKIKYALDVGAHIGSFTLTLKHFFPEVEIIAIEPEPGNFELLQLNVDGIDGIYVYNKAVSYETDVVIARSGDNSGGHIVMDRQQFLADDPATWSSQGYETAALSVATVTIEALRSAHEFDPIDLMKLDCEGCEVGIFQQMSEHTLQSIWYIVGEYHAGAAEFVRMLPARVMDRFQLTLSARGQEKYGYFLAVNVAHPLQAAGSAAALESPPLLSSTSKLSMRLPPAGTGWHSLEVDSSGLAYRWMNAPTATLEIPIAIVSDVNITVHIVASIVPELISALAIRVNDVPLRGTFMESGTNSCLYQVSVPQHVVERRNEHLSIRFDIPFTRRPCDLSTSTDRRELGVAIASVSFERVDAETPFYPTGKEQAVELDWLQSSLTSSGRILDISNGDNSHLSQFADRATDIDCIGEQFQSAVIPRGSTWFNQPLLGNTLPSASYDGVLAVRILSQGGLGAPGAEPTAGEDVKALLEIKRLLKPQGLCWATLFVGVAKATPTFRQYSPAEISLLFADWDIQVTYWVYNGLNYSTTDEFSVVSRDADTTANAAIAGIVARRK